MKYVVQLPGTDGYWAPWRSGAVTRREAHRYDRREDALDTAARVDGRAEIDPDDKVLGEVLDPLERLESMISLMLLLRSSPASAHDVIDQEVSYHLDWIARWSSLRGILIEAAAREDRDD